MIKILLGLVVLVGIYYYMRGSQTNQGPTGHILEPFVAGAAFSGAKNGYVFKMDSQGLGYYLDPINSS